MNATYREAAPTEMDSVMNVWTTVFQLGSDAFEGVLTSCPVDRKSTFVADVDGKIVSVVQVFAIPLRDELGREVTVGAIANVSTFKEYQGQGFSTQLLRLAIRDMEERGCKWSFLFTGVPDFYKRLGWDHVEYHTLRATLPMQDPTDIAPKQFLESDLSAIRPIYDDAYATIPLSVIRTEADWRLKLSPRLHDAFIVRHQASYAILKEEKNDLVLTELAVPNPAEVRPLLKGTFGWARSRGMKTVKFATPLPENIRQIVLDLLPHRWEPEGAGMVRPIDPEWTMERLQVLFNDPGARFAPHEGF